MSEEKSEIGKNVGEAFVGVAGLVIASVMHKVLQEVAFGNEPSLILDLICFGLAPCALATAFGYYKNRGMFGFILGFLFSWLGVIVIGCFKTRK